MITKSEIITYLNEISSDKFKKNVVKIGIPEEKMMVDLLTIEWRRLNGFYI